MAIESILFYTFGALAIVSAVMVVLQRNPIMSAIYLIGNFFCIAALYLLLQAQFLAVIQIVVYTGAIMVLVVFVIMLLNLGDESRLSEKFSLRKGVGSVFVAGFLLQLLYIFGFSGASMTATGLHPTASQLGTIESMGDALFNTYVFPFEVISLLLLTAIVGSVVLAKKRA